MMMRERVTQLEALDQMTGERDDAVAVSRGRSVRAVRVTR
jgi:hypothetical protein